MVLFRGKTYDLEYDFLNRLIREDSEIQDKSILYTYDAGGNLTSVKEYAYTTGTPSQLLGTSTGTYQMQSMNASCGAACVHEEVAIADDVPLGYSECPLYCFRGSVEGPDGQLDRRSHR